MRVLINLTFFFLTQGQQSRVSSHPGDEQVLPALQRRGRQIQGLLSLKFCVFCVQERVCITCHFFFLAQFFMKATQLEQMREDFIHIKATRHMTEDKVAQHGEVTLAFGGCKWHQLLGIKTNDA